MISLRRYLKGDPHVRGQDPFYCELLCRQILAILEPLIIETFRDQKILKISMERWAAGLDATPGEVPAALTVLKTDPETFSDGLALPDTYLICWLLRNAEDRLVWDKLLAAIPYAPPDRFLALLKDLLPDTELFKHCRLVIKQLLVCDQAEFTALREHVRKYYDKLREFSGTPLQAQAARLASLN